MAFSKPDTNILVVCERRSRHIALCKQASKTSQTVINNIGKILDKNTDRKCLSLTFDNGSEFTKHYLLREAHNIKTWFCDPRSPWQKGSVESAIGRLRRYLPRKTESHIITHDYLKEIVNAYNNTLRKCLGYKTPNEVFYGITSTVALQT